MRGAGLGLSGLATKKRTLLRLPLFMLKTISLPMLKTQITVKCANSEHKIHHELYDVISRLCRLGHLNTCIMVVILHDNSEIGAHVRNHFCYLICLRHSIRSRAVKNYIFFSKTTFSYMSVHRVLSYHLM